jgi:carbonic anhydrase
VTELQVATRADIPEVRRLFEEYASWVGIDLSFQDFARELAELPGDYESPNGVLFVARVEGKLAGCVAAHRWTEDTCEMKRLFVRDAYRGSGCGRALVDGIIVWARESGYRRILLDTLPVMNHAQLLYAKLGFEEVAAYRANPVPGARFLELALE